MKIVINGGGGVGEALADILSHEQHDITVIEQAPSRANALEETLDCRVMTGTGSSPSDLRDAGVGGCNIFLAVTNRDEVNLLSCLIAEKMGCPRSIARVRDRDFHAADLDLPVGELGIDQIINPDEEAAGEIVRLLRNPGTTQVIPLAGGAVIAAGIAVPPDSRLDGTTLAQLHSEHSNLRYRVVVINRDGEPAIPAGNDHIESGDELFIVAQPQTVKRLAAMIGQKPSHDQFNRVMILGASDLGRYLAEMLEGQCAVTLVDPHGRSAEDASAQLPGTLVIEGTGHDMDLLERVGLPEMDALVAVSDEEEMNLISCLYAKRLGVPRTIARIERPFYLPLMMTVDVDAAVSARQATVNAILKYVRLGDIKAVARMRGVGAEGLELVPGPGAKVLDTPLRNLRFPRGALVGVVVRPHEVVVPDGDTVIRKEDHVVVFALHQAVRKVEKLFARRKPKA
ncbi:MAG: Trk system potassium transporter TrkA [Phycisphaerae bacterium]|jgi:trk system potassium uptake protein TrkA|nr:Trk system potassium transporter TrkA [Phycisphaerae bacterium]